MSEHTGATDAGVSPASASRVLIVSALGITQILAWGSSYYLPAVLGGPIATDTGWPLPWVVGGLSLGLVVAGFSSPFVGRAIQSAGGRYVLALSSLFFGIGLAGLSVSESLPIYLGAWIVIGLGMGAGLYDAAFATLGRMYLKTARSTIAALTLFGGLASTVCWPLSAFLLEHLGWRGACMVYAGIQLFFALPLHLIVIPRRSSLPAIRADAAEPDKPSTRLIPSDQRLRFLVVASVIALASAISALVSVHLLTFLQNGGMPLAAAVALGALVGPAQVSARAIEMAFGRYYHPLWTMLAGTVLVTAGIGLLFINFPILSIGLILYGAGIGIESIARGTVPLAIFDPHNYAPIMGRVAMPSLIAQALAPWLGAILIGQGGSHLALAVLVTAAVANAALAVTLIGISRKSVMAAG